MGGNELFSPLGIGFIVFLIAALAIDFGLLRKNGTHVVPVKEAAAWTLVWIVLAIIFGVAMQIYWGDATKTTEYFVGYLVEKSLSVDNIFVFTIIFAALKTPKKLQQLALMWGILLALVLRGIMILIGAALIERFEWIIWVFGGFLLLTGVQMLRSGGHASEGEPSAVKLARRFIHVNNDYNEERFWIVKAGRRVFTPIFLTIAVIGIIDLVFAVDSIPAIFGITLDPFIVFTIIFAALKTPKKLQQLALMWGILLALVLRGIMILIGAALIERFEWIIWVFGGFLLLTGVQMLRSGGHASEGEPSAVKLARRFIHVNNDYNEERFWIVKAGRRVFTPIFLTIAVIGIIDLVFAVDSIPAIFGITLDPFIVFTSNAFAILGLRNLYFLLADAKDRFHYLSVGLAFVLMWIGVKMILPAINHDWKVPPLVSLVIVLSILTLSIVASLLRTKRVARKASRPARARKR